MLKILCIILGLLPSVCLAEHHWAVGGWDCRSWGSIKLTEDFFAVDLDPQGEMQDWGAWQNYDQHSIVIIWMDSYRIEIINEHYGKFYRQMAIEGFGIVSEVEETKKIIKEK